MSRPRFGKVRKEAYDVLGNANASQQQLTRALLALIAKASEVLDEIMDGSEFKVKIFGKVIPVSIIWNVKEEE